MKRLTSAQSDIYSMEVIECDCGFHIGLDATYLDQVGEIAITCPACKMIIDTHVVCPDEDFDDEKLPSIAIVRQDGWEGHRIYVKRMYLPFTLATSCPKCESTHVMDLNARFMSYPTLGENRLPLFCDECGHDWTIKVNLDIALTPSYEKDEENEEKDHVGLESF